LAAPLFRAEKKKELISLVQLMCGPYVEKCRPFCLTEPVLVCEDLIRYETSCRKDPELCQRSSLCYDRLLL